MTTWITPKTNWSATDRYNLSDAQRIWNNLAFLKEKAIEYYGTETPYGSLKFYKEVYDSGRYYNFYTLLDLSPDTFTVHAGSSYYAGFIDFIAYDSDNLWTLARLVALTALKNSGRDLFYYTHGDDYFLDYYVSGHSHGYVGYYSQMEVQYTDEGWVYISPPNEDTYLRDMVFTWWYWYDQHTGQHARTADTLPKMNRTNSHGNAVFNVGSLERLNNTPFWTYAELNLIESKELQVYMILQDALNF